METNDEIDKKIEELDIVKAIEHKDVPYVIAQIRGLINEARSEGCKEWVEVERQRCIGILKPLEKALSELKEAQKEWEFNPKYDTENALRNCAIIDVINQSKAIAKLSEKVD
jgi:cell fate (sporulation/competence/biofilm development) regulator YmcA (YheA/YmcA/DUF963 family)